MKLRYMSTKSELKEFSHVNAYFSLTTLKYWKVDLPDRLVSF